MRKNRHNQKGYTLLELLAAFSLVVLLASLVFNGLKFGNRVWTDSRQGFHDQQELLTARTLIKDWIENAHPIEATSGGHLRFKGTRRRVEFFAPLNPGSDFSRFYKISLEYRPLEKDILVRWQDLETSRGGKRTLLKGVEGLEISYFLENSETEKDWVLVWEAQETLPALVKVKFQLEEERGDFELIVPTLIDWGADCQFDISTRSCKGTGT